MMQGIKLLAVFLCLCVFAFVLSSCGKQDEIPPEIADEITVYATFYPFYVAAHMLTDGVDDINLNCLVQPQDGCLRDYQLSDWDIALLNSADLIIAGGCGLESFESTLYGFDEDGPVVASVLYNMDLATYSGINTQQDSDSHWLDANPHIYMSVTGMTDILKRTSAALILVDPEHENVYLENLECAEEKLSVLEQDLKDKLAALEEKKVIVMNEALIYAALGFGLEIDLAYERESGETLDGADLEDCMNKLDAGDTSVVLIEKQAPQSLCEALIAAGYHLAPMDTISTRRANEGSEAYFVAQRANANAVLTAFSEAAVTADDM